jgi:soluble lytic murein transglycosylase
MNRAASFSGREKNGVRLYMIFSLLKRAAAVLVLASLVIYAASQTGFVQKKVFYPYEYDYIVSEYAAARRLDEALVAGVIFSESRFRYAAESSRGAVGLMQIMPQTAEWIAEQVKFIGFTPEDLLDPETNIRFGTWYLASLREEFDDNEVLMLAAYNAGRGNVKSWMKAYNWTMDFNDIEQIPYKETREYVAKVLKSKQQYRKLYGI